MFQSKLLKVVRGTHDLLPSEVAKYDAVTGVFARVVRRMGFAEIRTPVMEHIAVFQRSLGLQSDVVSKEMFVLKSARGGDATCLRPEATAGSCGWGRLASWLWDTWWRVDGATPLQQHLLSSMVTCGAFGRGQ